MPSTAHTRLHRAMRASFPIHDSQHKKGHYMIHYLHACTRRVQRYTRASPRSPRSLEAHENQELERGIKASLMSYRTETQQCSQNINTCTGSAMDIDPPLHSASGTYGCVDTTMEDDECKVGPLTVVQQKTLLRDPRTKQARERMHIALQAALLGINVDEIMKCKQRSMAQTQTNGGGNNIGQIIDDYLILSAIACHIVNGVTCTVRTLGTALSTTSRGFKPVSRIACTTVMPGEYLETEQKKL
ncbi:uncharacterized protein HD556DRAFT_1306909 [Suillus plorans]|uniref:Uncharacterized protein n=1 Tax=Suillus plorans TaxID=116603 RepID=A0A9P7DK01_9AGAM|nr:uncharacterized protein HD556DRAFT_1306909 [Suillus plorans]KAG1796727.1 hypothetical protein HD556DRAFT_1306909 [Suillus plorans]